MKQKLLILGLVLSIAINVGFLTTAAYHSWERTTGEAHHKDSSFLKRNLNLSEPQLAEIESIKNSLDSKADVLKKELRETRIRLFNLLAEQDPNREEINKVLQELEALQVNLQKLAIEHLLQQKNILTSEQQRKYFSIISERLCPGEGHQLGPSFPGTGDHEEECQHDQGMEDL